LFFCANPKVCKRCAVNVVTPPKKNLCKYKNWVPSFKSRLGTEGGGVILVMGIIYLSYSYIIIFWKIVILSRKDLLIVALICE
jgi:hypothetical protein